MGRCNLMLEDATQIVVDGMSFYTVAFVDSSRMVLTRPYRKYATYEWARRLVQPPRTSGRNFVVPFDSITAVTLLSGGIEVETDTHLHRLLRFFEHGDREQRQDQTFDLIRLLDFIPESEDGFRFVPRTPVLGRVPTGEVETPVARIADAVLWLAARNGMALAPAIRRLKVDRPQPRVTLTFGRESPAGGSPQFVGNKQEFLDVARFRNERLGKYTKVVRANGSPAPVHDAVE